MTPEPKTVSYYSVHWVDTQKVKVRISKFSRDWEPESSYVLQMTSKLGWVCACPARTMSCRHLKIIQYAQIELMLLGDFVTGSMVRYDSRTKLCSLVSTPDALLDLIEAPEPTKGVTDSDVIDIFEDI